MPKVCCVGEVSGPVGLIFSILLSAAAVTYGFITEDYFTLTVGALFPILGVFYFFVARSSVYLSRETDKLSRSNAEHQRLLDVEKGLAKDLESQIKEQGELVEQERQNNEEHRRQLELRRKQLVTEKKLAEDLRNQIAQHKSQLEVQKENNRKAQTQLTEHKQLLNSEKQTVYQLQAQVAEHKTQLDKQKELSDQLNLQLADHQTKLHKSTQLNSQLEHEIGLLKDERNKLAKQTENLNRMQRKNVKMIQMMALYGDECKTLGMSLSETSKELRATDESLGLTSKEMAVQMNVLKTVINELKITGKNQGEKGGDTYDDEDYSFIPVEPI